MQKNDNENMRMQNLQEAANIVLRGKFIAIQPHLKKHEKSQATYSHTQSNWRKKKKLNLSQKDRNHGSLSRNKTNKNLKSNGKDQ